MTDEQLMNAKHRIAFELYVDPYTGGDFEQLKARVEYHDKVIRAILGTLHPDYLKKIAKKLDEKHGWQNSSGLGYESYCDEPDSDIGT
jgi:hypothetical protein